MQIAQVFNNNVVLATDASGKHLILTGRGLGFAAKAGDPVGLERVQQTFVPDATHTQDVLVDFLTEIPPEHLSLAQQILDLGRARLETDFPHSLILPVADHISFAIKRVRQGITMEYPLRAEVAHLYPRELAAAREAVDLVIRRTGLPIPADEAVPIALHFVNAQFATDDLSRTFRMTEVFRQVFEVLESAYSRAFDSTSMNAARFITHLRYFFVRVDSNQQLTEKPSVFSAAIRESFGEAYACALKVRALLELRLGKPITDDEVTYLTLHVARLAADEPAAPASD